MCPTSIIHQSKGLGKEQMALVTMDVFTGKVTLEIKEVLQENSILATNVPTNMTRFYQPFDLPVNRSAKGFIAMKFYGWYSEQISEELQSGIPLEDIGVKLRLSILKSLHAGWETDFYNFITSAEGKKIILNGWKATGIYDAIRLGIGKLPTVDPYHDIDPLVNESNIPVAKNLEAVCLLNQDQLDLFHTREDKDEDDDNEEHAWEPKIQTSNAFDIFQDFHDEQSL